MGLPHAVLIINFSDSLGPAQSSKYDARILSLTLVLLSKSVKRITHRFLLVM